MEEKEYPDPYLVRSPWGGIAAFFMIQCFGFVLLQGFRMFLEIARAGADPLSVIESDSVQDRIFLSLWGGAWILAFVAFQADIFNRISEFSKRLGFTGILRAITSPAETAKFCVAIIFASVFVMFLFGKYPFPYLPISKYISVAFSLSSWIVSWGFTRALRKAGKQTFRQQHHSVFFFTYGIILSSAFVVIALISTPKLFYFHGLIGLGTLTMLFCRILLSSSHKVEHHSETPSRMTEK